MPEIKARVIADTNGVSLKTRRQGTCQSCSHIRHCSMQWQIKESEHSIQTANLAFTPGEELTLQCSERTLLRYIACLFLPSLTALILFNGVLLAWQNEPNPAVSFFFGLVVPLTIGSVTSWWLLRLVFPDVLEVIRFEKGSVVKSVMEE